MDFRRLLTTVAPVLLGVSAYMVCRLAVAAEYHLTTGTSMIVIQIPVYNFYTHFPAHYLRFLNSSGCIPPCCSSR